jgi:hypothetical protein
VERMKWLIVLVLGVVAVTAGCTASVMFLIYDLPTGVLNVSSVLVLVGLCAMVWSTNFSD